MDKFRLFFSHRTADAPQVEELQAKLGTLLPNLPFEDLSRTVPYEDDWKVPASSVLAACDGLICMVGENTHLSEPVDWEVREAHRLGKPLVVTRMSDSYLLPPCCADLGLPATTWDTATIAGQIGELLVSRALFLHRQWPGEKPDWTALVHQYTLMVESWEALIARRQTVNTLYVSATAALLTGIGVLVAGMDRMGPLPSLGGILLVALLGAALSFNWRRTILSYGILSRAKARVVTTLEGYMPAQLFDAEWRVLEAKRYKSTTETDKQTAFFFALVFLVIALVAGGMVMGQMM